MLDTVQIHFNPDSFALLNGLLALMMFGASLSVRVDDFRYLLRAPKAPLIGLVSQFVLLPAITFVVTQWLNVDPSMALGMILVASCPGGSFSNIMTWLSRGHLATSVSMTGISTVAALIMTPFNFAFYAGLDPQTAQLLANISVAPLDIMKLILVVLVLPLAGGMFVGRAFPTVSSRLDTPFRWLSMLLFFGFVGIAFSSNGEIFLEHAHKFIGLVILHNALALGLGYLSSRLMKLPEDQTRAVTLEVGIQNSGLGLIILFNFYPDLGGMLIITAFWGVWHLVSGLSLSLFWSRRPALTAS
ncbi:bile acid:sodium symporter family protein [Reinekea blandensis]|uniref:bile acid:sodium symporter family protein n=1 Tax=Reinekea blandensis TaxID=374838 RepID=UPI000322908C|nr:bile acid:sodium symporter family protein [Reinekea blandensis]